MNFTLSLLPIRLAVCRLEPTDDIPQWATAGSFFSVTRSDDELSVVAEESLVPPSGIAERGWRALMLHGPIPFSATGVLHALTAPAAEARIGIVAISTYDTDYLLVKEYDLVALCDRLRLAGMTVTPHITVR